MFIPSKVSGLQSSLPNIKELAVRLPTLLAQATSQSNPSTSASASSSGSSIQSQSKEHSITLDNAIKTLILTSLWGNKADLSLWPDSNNIQGSICLVCIYSYSSVWYSIYHMYMYI